MISDGTADCSNGASFLLRWPVQHLHVIYAAPTEVHKTLINTVHLPTMLAARQSQNPGIGFSFTKVL